ncbi:hypothetical protein D3C87_1325200 [compost metagenome]
MAPGQVAYLRLRVGPLAQVGGQVVQRAGAVAAQPQRRAQPARLGVIGVLGQHALGLHARHGVAGFRRQVEQFGGIEGDTGQADAHQRLAKLAGGVGTIHVVLHQRQDIGGAEIRRAIQQVVPVAARAGEIVEPEGDEAGVEVRGPLARRQPVAARGLVEPRQRLGVLPLAHQQRAVKMGERAARRPAVHRRQRQLGQTGHGGLQRGQRAGHIVLVRMQLRLQRGVVDHFGVGLAKLVGDL